MSLSGLAARGSASICLPQLCQKTAWYRWCWISSLSRKLKEQSLKGLFHFPLSIKAHSQRCRCAEKVKIHKV